MTRRANQMASLVALAALTFMACGSQPGGSNATLSSTEATTTTSPGATIGDTAEVDAEAEAITRIEAFFTALNEGRVDDMAEIFGREIDDAERLLWEFNATLEEVYPREFGPCEVTQAVGSLITIDCAVRFTDPVHVATGVAEVVYPYRYQDGVITWQTMRVAEGRDSPFTGSAAVAEYLELFHPEGHEACSDVTYIGTPIIYNGHLALVPGCAEVFIRYAPDISAWVEAGQPTDWSG